MQMYVETFEALASVLNAIKANGKFTTIVCETAAKFNKFPTDGSERVRIDEEKAEGVKKSFSLTYHWNDSTYEKKMAAALGVDDYKAHDDNRIHLVDNVLMQYVSTGNICLIAMPTDIRSNGLVKDGQPLSDDLASYLAHYKQKHKQSAVPYLTIGAKNVKEIHCDGSVIVVNIKPQTETNVA